MSNGNIHRLREHRYSIPHARYFITCVTARRAIGLAKPDIFKQLSACVEKSSSDTWALVLMPDHLHMLISLPERFTIGDVVRRIKGPLTPLMRIHGLSWQKNYFERRLRADDTLEPYLIYMMSNPYRSDLVDVNSRWPYWGISEQLEWFERKFPSQIPESEWLGLAAPWEDAIGEG